MAEVNAVVSNSVVMEVQTILPSEPSTREEFLQCEFHATHTTHKHTHSITKMSVIAIKVQNSPTIVTVYSIMGIK